MRIAVSVGDARDDSRCCGQAVYLPSLSRRGAVEGRPGKIVERNGPSGGGKVLGRAPPARPALGSRDGTFERGGRQEMMGAIDAVCDSARRIIGRLAARSDGGEALVPGDAPGGGGDRPPTAAMKKYAASIANRKGIKPPRGYTKSAAVCRAFLDRHAPGQSQPQKAGSPASGPASGASAGEKPGTAGTAGSGKRATGPAKPRQRKPGRDETDGSPGTPQPAAESGTPLRIPYGNKELAFGLGARYRTEGWYAPPGVDLAAFRERGWL